MAWAAARSGVMGLAAVAAGASAAPLGWPAVAGVAAVVSLASAWLRLRGKVGGLPAEGSSGVGPAARQLVHTQASGLARQVVPVWQRNVDTARLHAEQNMGALTESFGAIIVGLEQALGGTAASRQLDGATIDELLARHRPEIDQLLAATRRIAKAKDDMAGGAAALADALVETTRLTKEVQTIGRATHLLALNASVEAARAGGGGASAAGFAAVAQEVQNLATQSRQAGHELAKHLARMQERVQAMKLQGARLDCDDDELMLQAEQQARALVWGLLASLSEVAQSQRSLHDAGEHVQTEMERILVSLQSQDRFSQMLQSVTEDMQRLHAWLEGQQDEAAASAHQWLERLEATYTMEEMRTSHHGTVQVEKTSEVEFF